MTTMIPQTREILRRISSHRSGNGNRALASMQGKPTKKENEASLANRFARRTTGWSLESGRISGFIFSERQRKGAPVKTPILSDGFLGVTFSVLLGFFISCACYRESHRNTELERSGVTAVLRGIICKRPAKHSSNYAKLRSLPLLFIYSNNDLETHGLAITNPRFNCLELFARQGNDDTFRQCSFSIHNPIKNIHKRSSYE